jgi:23S rRNA (uracil1939-C5)-methyltransferase
MKRSNNSASLFEIEIEKLVYGGSGLGRFRGKVVFVPYSAPGDRLLVRPVLQKKDYIRAEIANILDPGPGRTDPECPHFGRCGGCHWQHLEYPRQVEAKLRILEEICRHRFPRTRDIPVSMKACPQPMGYRSRARLQVRHEEGFGRSVGFYRTGSHSVESIERCPLLRSPLDQALDSLRDVNSGRNLGTYTGEIDIAGSCEENLWAASPVGNENAAKNTYPGKEKDTGATGSILKRKVGEFIYSVSASVFFQANDFIVPDLVQLVRELASDSPQNAAVDLFAGVGLFSLPLVFHFKTVVSVENSPSASRLCSENARAAGADSLRTVCADVQPWLESAHSSGMRGIDLILLDPPRTGVGAGVMEKIRVLSPETIIYVSCDPQTLCRDLSCIPPEEYRIDRIEGLDMFPQTYHFETVVRLKRR